MIQQRRKGLPPYLAPGRNPFAVLAGLGFGDADHADQLTTRARLTNCLSRQPRKSSRNKSLLNRVAIPHDSSSQIAVSHSSPVPDHPAQLNRLRCSGLSSLYAHTASPITHYINKAKQSPKTGELGHWHRRHPQDESYRAIMNFIH